MEAAKAQELFDAEACLQEVVDLEPWWGFAHLQLGTVRMALGAMAEARENLERAVSLLPLDSEVHDALSHCCSELGELERSQRHAWLAMQLEDSSLDELSLQR
jgi:tetratricopeptide (TPR) repeat protein